MDLFQRILSFIEVTPRALLGMHGQLGDADAGHLLKLGGERLCLWARDISRDAQRRLLNGSAGVLDADVPAPLVRSDDLHGRGDV